ncbi:GLPGLI family protein [Elizabethkingia anophelis]|uniref:GLPGLI family protein n=1 Tax=Elizabethkingia anophelis TaxID=1117645 RepID=UPI003891520F
MKYFLIFLSIYINSQIGINVKYHYRYVNDTLKNNIIIKEMNLDIKKNEVKYYYQSFYEMDSTKNMRSGSVSVSAPDSQLIKRKLDGWQNENFVFAKGKYFVIKSNDTLRWKVLEETKIVKGYKLQKAKTDFGGRKWTAWFCTDIPFQEGPYKFRGLPGLIFEIYDNKGYFTYQIYKINSLTKSIPTENFLETNFGKKPIPITRDEYNKLLLDDYFNPFSDMFGTGINEENELFIFGKLVKNAEDIKEILTVYQKHKRELYNPIELDKAVKYPSK